MLTWVEINSKAIRHNIKQFRKLVGPDVLLMPVIKANAYGHGFLNVAKICQQNREVDRICVANLDEAVNLIKNNILKPIIILSFFELNDRRNLSLAIKNNVVFPIYDIKSAKILQRLGKKMNKKIKAHVKIDTGTSRVGILPDIALTFVEQISKFKNIEIEGLYSHFASSEEDAALTRQQFNIFKKVLLGLKKKGINPPIKHMACSAASILHKFTHGNAVRLGLSLYGLYPSSRSQKFADLKPALSWYTKIIQIKKIRIGVNVGYGGTFKTSRPTTLAIIPVGYWDGYDRRLSNRAFVLINKKRCPIVGRICMNLSMIDITHVKTKVGDRVTLIGGKNKTKISADELANWAGTINYEIVDRINPLLPRITT